MLNSEKTTYLLTHILDNKNINILLLGNTIDQTTERALPWEKTN